MKKKIFGKVENQKIIKEVHDAVVIEWNNGEVEVMWGECKDKLREKLIEI